MSINYNLNQALIRLRAAMVELDDVTCNKVHQDELWSLEYKWPFSGSIEEATKKVTAWADHHIKKDEDEE